jgi:hypothetical protein
MLLLWRRRCASATSVCWQKLRLQLGPQEDTGRRSRFRWPLLRKRARADVPMSIQHAFAHITHEARTPYIPSMLRYQLLPQGQELAVRSSWLGRRKIWLFLPIDAATTIGQTELEVLLATGLARSMCARKPPYPLARLLLAGVVLIACLTPIFFWMHHVPLVGAPSCHSTMCRRCLVMGYASTFTRLPCGYVDGALVGP